MFIARIKCLSPEDKTSIIVKTFGFETRKDLDEALKHLQKCGCPLFAAETESRESTSGHLIGKWNAEKKATYWQGYTTECGRYKDSCWVHFGTNDECQKWADITNERAVSYFCTSASVSHVAGDLWRVDYRTPYND